MTYPHTENDNSVIEYCYGIKGLKRTMLFNDKAKSNYRYKKVVVAISDKDFYQQPLLITIC